MQGSTVLNVVYLMMEKVNLTLQFVVLFFQVELLSNQKQMMEKISLLDSKLENLHSDDASSRSAVKDMLIEINDRLEQLNKSAPQGCCGGPVIIQTTPHANVVHQPILSSCKSCSGTKEDERHTSLMTVSNGESDANKERNNQISTDTLGRVSTQTPSDADPSEFTKKSSGEHPPTILIPDSQDESLGKSQTVASSTASPCITSHSPSVPSAAESSVSVNEHGHSVTNVPGTKQTTCVPSNQSLAVSNKEQLSKAEACASIVKESSSKPNATRPIVLVVNQSPTVTSTANPKLLELKLLAASREQKDSASECVSTFSTPPQQRVSVPCKQTGVASAQTTPMTSPHSAYIDLQSTLGVSPVLSTVVRSPATSVRSVPMETLSESNHLPRQAAVRVNNSSIGIPLQKSNNESSRISPHTTTTASTQSSIPPAFIALSHTNLTPSPSKVHGISPLQPCAWRMTSQTSSLQRKDLHLTPSVGAVMHQSGE